jgi:uncharacterized protein YndB with AHSA1/START domain
MIPGLPMARFVLERKVDAPAEVVFDVASDHAGYARFSRLRSSSLEREGDPAPNGVGAIRALRMIGPPVREEITEFEAPRRFAYRMLSGVPVRSHTGTVEVIPEGERSHLRVAIDSVPLSFIPGGAWVAVMRPVFKQVLVGIARESERRAHASARR